MAYKLHYSGQQVEDLLDKINNMDPSNLPIVEQDDISYGIGVQGEEVVLYPVESNKVFYDLSSSIQGDSIVNINNISTTIAAGTSLTGQCTDIDFPVGTDNLQTIFINGDIDFNLSPQDEYEGEENNTLEQLRVICSTDFERSYDQFCHGFDVLKTVHITGSKPTSLYKAFRDCESLESLKIDNLNLDSLLEIHQICYNCPSLSSFTVTNTSGSTSKVVNLANMFNQSQIVDLDLSWIDDTSNVKQCNAMLYDCNKLQTLTIGDWDFNSCTQNINNWMYNCTSLTTINGNLKNIMLNIDCSYSPLDKESAVMIINGLYDYSDGDSHTVTFSVETRDLLSDDDIQTATNKNWVVLPE